MSNGFCEECEYERAWNNKAEDEVNRKWKEKYGDASVEEVASYR